MTGTPPPREDPWVLGAFPDRPGRCGRQLKTRKGVTCTNGTLWGALACKSHLLPEEREVLVALIRAHEEWLGEHEPACWSWPVPHVPQFTGEDQAEDFLLDWHEHRCAICGFPHFDLILDHDHATGLVRGRLCRSCNIAEGMGNVPVVLKYRRRNPASILGIQAVYWSPFTGYAEPVPDEDPGEKMRRLREAVDRMSMP
jgi:hypothetical protein